MLSPIYVYTLLLSRTISATPTQGSQILTCLYVYNSEQAQYMMTCKYQSADGSLNLGLTACYTMKI